MKVLIPALFFLLTGCQPQKKAETALPVNQTIDSVNVHIENEPPLNIPLPKRMYQSPSREQAIVYVAQRQAMLGRLWQVSPIPVPGASSIPAISPETAHERYLGFVKAYAADSILPLFQQRYARILLNEYGWLKTGRADIIGYYVDQLIVSKSRDFDTVTQGLTVLADKLPAPRFILLRDQTLPLLEEKLTLERNRLSALIRRVEHATDQAVVQSKQTPAGAEMAKRELLLVRDWCRRDSISLVRLRALRAGGA